MPSVRPAITDEAPSQGGDDPLARVLAPQLGHTVPTMSLRIAVARRLRRIYVHLFAVQLLAWALKLSSHPIPVTSLDTFVRHASVGPVPGSATITAVALLFGGIVLHATSRRRHRSPGGRGDALIPEPAISDRLTLPDGSQRIRRMTTATRSSHAIAAAGLMASIAFALIACSEFEDPTLDRHFDPATAAPPPPRTKVTPSATRNLLWGDLHVHTSLSYDAFTTGTRTLPDDAYTHMKGGTIEHPIGYPIRAGRPLDFGAVTDHAEYLGVPRHQTQGGQAESDALRAALRSGSPLRVTWHMMSTVYGQMASRERREESFGVPGMEEVSRAAWQQIIDAAERHDDPGRFTTFIAYEWSSMPADRNLHRNVIYASSAVPDYPFSSRDSPNPEDLWRALDEQRRAGISSLAIPHNSNVSDGRMFESNTFAGEPLDATYAETRARNEPLVEIFQIKGTSETHPSLSPDDAFADFEIMDTVMSAEAPPSEPRGSYARDALRTGLGVRAPGGLQPLPLRRDRQQRQPQRSSSSVEEDDYHGKLPLMDGTPGATSRPRLRRRLIPYERLPHGGPTGRRDWWRSGPRPTRGRPSSRPCSGRRPSLPRGRAFRCDSSRAGAIRTTCSRGTGSNARMRAACRWAERSRRVDRDHRPSWSPRSRTRLARISTACRS